MKKIKLPLIILFVSLVIIVLTFGLASLTENNKLDSKNDKLLTSITELVKKDYLATNLILGKPTTDEASVVIDGTKYDIVIDKNLSGIADLQNIIFNTYTDDALESYLLELDKYNKYVEVENTLYVNVNSLCTVSNFDENIKIIKKNDNEIVIKNNNKEIKVVKKDGKYKLQESAYNCK